MEKLFTITKASFHLYFVSASGAMSVCIIPDNWEVLLFSGKDAGKGSLLSYYIIHEFPSA